MVRLKDIAARAGVSVMTVSKALREERDVSAATRERIRLLARQMGYVPDSMAQGLRTRSSKLFGLVISAATNPIFARIVMAIEDRAHALGYDVMFAHSLNLIEREEHCIRRFLSRRVDGLFISPVYRFGSHAPIYEEVARQGTPTVILGHVSPFCRQFVSVATEDLLGSYALTRHLVQLGHRRIAYLAGPPASAWGQERLAGYQRALREANIEVDDRLIFNAGSTIDEGVSAALQLLNEAPRITALQAVNDLVAIGAANVLLDQGWKIPQDISVAGFGNILSSEFFRVPLTTLRQPKLRLGHAAMEVMQQLMRGERPLSRRLPADLILRGSTAPPPAEVARPATR